MYECQDCRKQFDSSQGHNCHRRHCKLKQMGTSAWEMLSPQAKENLRRAQLERIEKIKIPRGLCLTCGEREVSEAGGKYCSQSCAATSSNKGRVQSKETRDKIGAALAGRDLGGKVQRICLECKEPFTAQRTKEQKYCSIACSSKSPLRSLNIAIRGSRKGKGGGYREGSGRSFKGRYKGFYCGSTYELIFLIDAFSKGLPIQRCNHILSYEFDGEMRKYFPDFEIDGVIYEVKGFHNARSLEKARQHPEVILVDRHQIMEMQKSHPEICGKTYHDLALMYDDPLKPTHSCEYCKGGFFSKHGARFCSIKCGAFARSTRSKTAKAEK